MLKRMIQTEDQRNSILKDLSRRMFEKFSNEYETWKKCVDLVGILDVLTSMATYGNTQSHLCFPKIEDGDDGVSYKALSPAISIFLFCFSAYFGNGRRLSSLYEIL